MSSHLQLRLKNCLQTILELEPDLDQLPVARRFQTDMETLKGYLSRVEDMELAEEDVMRLESATAHFLAELRMPLHRIRQGSSNCRILQ